MRERSSLITNHNSNATTMAKILAAIDAQIYRYAGDVYAELRFSEVQATLFESARVSVDAALVAMGGSALRKLDSISERLTAGDDEAVSQAMSSCRRLIDAAADHLFPAQDDPLVVNGQPLSVKQGNVLNRLSAYVHSRGVSGGRADRLRRALSDLYGRVSTGVHADVDGSEATYVFLNTYVVLGELFDLQASGSARSS